MRTQTADMPEYIKFPPADEFVANHGLCYQAAFGASGHDTLGVQNFRGSLFGGTKNAQLLHYMIGGVPLRKNARTLNPAVPAPRPAGNPQDPIHALMPLLTRITQNLQVNPACTIADVSSPFPHPMRRLRTFMPAASWTEEKQLCLPAAPVQDGTQEGTQPQPEAPPGTDFGTVGEKAPQAPKTDVSGPVTRMEEEMGCGVKRKSIQEEVKLLKTKRPKMPSDTGTAKQGKAYVKKYSNGNKWRIVFPASSKGGPWERTRQWSDQATKKDQFINALETIEKRMLEIATSG